MKIKNVNTKIIKRVAAFALVTTLSTVTLTGCGNMDMWDTQYTFNKAVVVNGDVATIVEVKSWTDYDGEQIQIATQDGLVFLVNSDNIYPMDTRNTDITPEDFARSLVGKNGEITYLEEVKNTKTK